MGWTFLPIAAHVCIKAQWYPDLTVDLTITIAPVSLRSHFNALFWLPPCSKSFPHNKVLYLRPSMAPNQRGERFLRVANILNPPIAPLNLEEISDAIPAHGITIADLAAKFKSRLEGDEAFKTLVSMVKRVADIDMETTMCRLKEGPTNAEVLAAIPSQGIPLAELEPMWQGKSMSTVARIARLLSRIVTCRVGDESHILYLRGCLTAADVARAIPDEGTTPSVIILKFHERFLASSDYAAEYMHLMEILTEIADWVEHTHILVLRDSHRILLQDSGRNQEETTIEGRMRSLRIQQT